MLIHLLGENKHLRHYKSLLSSTAVYIYFLGLPHAEQWCPIMCNILASLADTSVQEGFEKEKIKLFKGFFCTLVCLLVCSYEMSGGDGGEPSLCGGAHISQSQSLRFRPWQIQLGKDQVSSEVKDLCLRPWRASARLDGRTGSCRQTNKQAKVLL